MTKPETDSEIDIYIRALGIQHRSTQCTQKSCSDCGSVAHPNLNLGRAQMICCSFFNLKTLTDTWIFMKLSGKEWPTTFYLSAAIWIPNVSKYFSCNYSEITAKNPRTRPTPLSTIKWIASLWPVISSARIFAVILAISEFAICHRKTIERLVNGKQKPNKAKVFLVLSVVNCRRIK